MFLNSIFSHTKCYSFQHTKTSKSACVKRMSKKREKRVFIMVLWMNFAFMTCWLPYAVICFVYLIGGRGFVNPSIVVIPLLAAKSSVCWNPVLYIVMNPQVSGNWCTVNEIHMLLLTRNQGSNFLGFLITITF